MGGRGRAGVLFCSRKRQCEGNSAFGGERAEGKKLLMGKADRTKSGHGSYPISGRG